MKRESCPERWKTQRKRKQNVIVLEVKFKSKFIIEEIAEHRNVDTVAICETEQIQLKGFSKSVFLNTNEKSGCEEKNDDVSWEVMVPKTFILKALSE